jgi:hypothetical protein
MLHVEFTAKHIEGTKHDCFRDGGSMEVHRTPDGLYYAVDLAHLGCSKNYFTPEDAVRGLLLDHAYTDIRIA